MLLVGVSNLTASTWPHKPRSAGVTGGCCASAVHLEQLQGQSEFLGVVQAHMLSPAAGGCRGASLLAPWVIVQPGVARWPVHVSLGLEEVVALSKAKVNTLQGIEHLL